MHTFSSIGAPVKSSLRPLPPPMTCAPTVVRGAALATLAGDFSQLSMSATTPSWEAVDFFCDEAISHKEAANHERDDAVDADPLRQR